MLDATCTRGYTCMVYWWQGWRLCATQVTSLIIGLIGVRGTTVLAATPLAPTNGWHELVRADVSDFALVRILATIVIVAWKMWAHFRTSGRRGGHARSLVQKSVLLSNLFNLHKLLEDCMRIHTIVWIWGTEVKQESTVSEMASILCNKSSFAGATKVQSAKRSVARSPLVVRAQQESVDVVRIARLMIKMLRVVFGVDKGTADPCHRDQRFHLDM